MSYLTCYCLENFQFSGVLHCVVVLMSPFIMSLVESMAGRPAFLRPVSEYQNKIRGEVPT